MSSPRSPLPVTHVNRIGDTTTKVGGNFNLSPPHVEVAVGRSRSGRGSIFVIPIRNEMQTADNGRLLPKEDQRDRPNGPYVRVVGTSLPNSISGGKALKADYSYPPLHLYPADVQGRARMWPLGWQFASSRMLRQRMLLGNMSNFQT